MADGDDEPRVGFAYAIGQLARALRSAGSTALRRAEDWRNVIAGMLDGTLRIGSRTPVSSVPAWATLKVVHGGFATRDLVAGGPLLPHEEEALAALSSRSSANARAALNAHFLTDEGRRWLSTMLAEGRYRIHVPEEGALLAVSWLRDRGERERADGVVRSIAPFFDRLRFYPVPHARAARTGDNVHLETAGAVVDRLRSTRPSRAVERMVEALDVWTPLSDRAVALFLETVEGEPPTLRTTEGGALARAANGQPIVDGGWPCRRDPPGWTARARKLLEDHREARARNPLCRKPDKPKENYARLRGFVEHALATPGALSARDVATIRRILASHAWAHGSPGSARLEGTRAAQRRIALAPRHHVMAAVVADRIATAPADEGVPDLAARVAPLSATEAARVGSTQGFALPARVVAKAKRCLDASPETLVDDGVVGSGEVLATLVPALSAHVRGSSIESAELRRLYEAVYAAFRRRRSLLLLDLQTQVRLSELPWISAIEPWVGSDDASRAAARHVLARVSQLTLRAFPHAIVPNRLVTELRALSSAAGLDVPLVNELAADIFTGAFSEAFLRAGQAAARLLSGSLYERYYGVPFERVLAVDDVERERFGTPSSPGFATLCEELAGVSRQAGWSVARNGTIIEQAQIVTTHNLAALFSVPEIERALRPHGPDLAARSFDWVRRRLRLAPSRPGALRAAKNAAYAWRQMVFYLSVSEARDVDRLLGAFAASLSSGDPDLRTRLAPVLSGLRAAAGGERVGPASAHRIFLGWSLGPHWILERE